jgi:hypothetical protein
MTEYQEQLARVKRFRQRLSGPITDQLDFEDMLWALFQNCWHLKDWIHYDPAAPQTLRNNVEKDASKFDSLMKCSDLCNRSKHLALTRSIRRDAKIRGEIKATVGGESPGIEFTYYVTEPSSPDEEALSLADQAIKDWETLIRNRGGAI